jgi:hypothetical protein
MLSAFASAGARAFNVTLTDINGEKVKGGYRPNTPLEQLRRTIARSLQEAERNRHNVIIRPRSTDATLIQLDDLDSEKAKRIAPYALIEFQTSPGNFQAWVAVEKDAAEDFSRRVRKGAGADPTASGATRIAGSLNFKTKYAPAFPRVTITHTNPGNITSSAALDQAGFVAAPEETRPALILTPPQAAAPRPANKRPKTSSGRPRWKKWPSYAFCIQYAPKTHGEDRPDVSRADFTWCRSAIEWGWGIEDTARRLMEFSEKAKTDGERYAILTATNAAASVKRQPYRERSTPDPR